jgi:hypothetical protein
MFGKKESTFKRDYFWGNTSTKISGIHIELKDQNKTIISLADKSDDKNPKYPDATNLITTRNPQNGDLMLDYLKDELAFSYRCRNRLSSSCSFSSNGSSYQLANFLYQKGLMPFSERNATCRI